MLQLVFIIDFQIDHLSIGTVAAKSYFGSTKETKTSRTQNQTFPKRFKILGTGGLWMFELSSVSVVIESRGQCTPPTCTRSRSENLLFAAKLSCQSAFVIGFKANAIFVLMLNVHRLLD